MVLDVFVALLYSHARREPPLLFLPKQGGRFGDIFGLEFTRGFFYAPMNWPHRRRDVLLQFSGWAADCLIIIELTVYTGTQM